MRQFLTLACVAALAAALPQPQVSFGGQKEDDAGTRLGLLASQLGLNPTGSAGQRTGSFSELEARVPGGGSHSHSHAQAQAVPAAVVQANNQDQCCCIPADQDCFDLYAVDDLVGQGLIDPRHQETELDTRIVNRPPAQPHQLNTLDTCPASYKTCCYAPDLDLSVFQRNAQCLTPYAAAAATQQQQQLNQQHHSSGLHYGCQETSVYGAKTCGTRNYPGPVSGLSYGQASPGEFPWTCILLNQDNDFVGTCAVIPSDSSNNNNAPTRKVLTAAHKLKNIAAADLLKVRVGEWDASGFNAPEQQQHEEYTVVRILKHPDMSNTRLSDDIALLTVDRDISLASPYVNTACLPSCSSQFSHVFSNGSGVRCHVAGWGKDEIDGTFQFIPKKVDLSLVPGAQCEASLKNALNSRQPGTGDRFQLHPSEICAGGEVGKDACVGDGGSPLVCQAQSGRWTVVGLVSWGIGCASDLPGVYVDVAHYRDWINAN